MQSDDPLPPRSKSWEDDLRDMIDGREQEKDSEWKRKSRKLSIIVLVSLGITAIAILNFPDHRQTVGSKTTVVDPEIAAAAEAILNQTGQKADVPDEMKPFVPQPGSASRTEDVRFATELFNFLELRERTKAPAETPATPPETTVPAGR